MTLIDTPPSPRFSGSHAEDDVAPLSPQYLEGDMADLATLLNGGLKNSHFSSAVADRLSGAKIGVGTLPGDRLVALSVAAAQLGAACVITEKIGDDEVTAVKIKGNTVRAASGYWTGDAAQNREIRATTEGSEDLANLGGYPNALFWWIQDYAAWGIALKHDATYYYYSGSGYLVPRDGSSALGGIDQDVDEGWDISHPGAAGGGSCLNGLGKVYHWIAFSWSAP